MTHNYSVLGSFNASTFVYKRRVEWVEKKAIDDMRWWWEDISRENHKEPQIMSFMLSAAFMTFRYSLRKLLHQKNIDFGEFIQAITVILWMWRCLRFHIFSSNRFNFMRTKKTQQQQQNNNENQLLTNCFSVFFSIFFSSSQKFCDQQQVDCCEKIPRDCSHFFFFIFITYQLQEGKNEKIAQK